MRSLSGRSKLALSLAGNLAAKAPAIAILLIALPKASQTFGSATYGQILAVLALSAVFGFPLNGLNVTARRLIAQCDATGDSDTEASVFLSSCLIALVLAAGAGVIASWLANRLGYSDHLAILTGVLAALAFSNVFDSIRAAYNEHFVTAAIQIVIQSLFLAALLASDLNTLGAASVGFLLGGSMAVSSVLGAAILILQRPRLLRGSPGHVAVLLRGASFVAASDGAMLMILNVSVVWIGATAGSAAAAWYGTLSRLFQSLLSPALLLLFPLTSYLASRWPIMAPSRRQATLTTFAAGSLGYGCLVALLLSLGEHYYVGEIVGIPTWGDPLVTLTLSAAMGAFVAIKSYSLLSYSIDESRRLSIISALIVLVGVALALIITSPTSALVTVGALLTVTIVTLIVLDVGIRRAEIARTAQPEIE